MTYLQGFVIPVKPGQKQAYHDMAAKAAPVFADCGATRIVECWGEEVPAGTRTDFRRAVKAEEGEDIVFSWIVWPDKATCDAGAEKMQADERMDPGDTPMPFDMQRMIYAGFDVTSDRGKDGPFGYIDGMVAPVAADRRQAFDGHAAFMTDQLVAKGARRVVNGWGADIADGKVTDFKRAVDAQDGEAIVFGWIEWPDRAARDAGWNALMSEGAMQQHPPVWDGKRAIFGGFAPILDTDHV